MASSDKFTNIKKILLSPHSDDACFSLGVFAKTSQKAYVINIFTKSGYLPGMHGLNQEDAISRVTSIRESEDLAFAKAASLQIESLDLLDAPLRGLEPFKSKPSSREEEYINDAVFSVLTKIWNEFGQNTMLLAPAGIGGHVDHVTIRDWMIKHINKLSSKYVLGFYEDLHYASDAEKRSNGIEELVNHLPKSYFLSRVRIPFDGNEAVKLKLLEIYASQFRLGSIDLEKYIPAENDEKRPHEAFWLVSKISSYL